MVTEKKIIFVDDEKKVLKSLKRVFYPMRKKWTVFLFNSPQDALKKIEEEKIDVIFTDIKMPGISGLELLQTIKALSPSTLRIALSGQADMDANQDRKSVV